MEVGTRWTLSLIAMILRLSFLSDSYYFSIYCLIRTIVLSTFIQWAIVLHPLLFSCHYCSGYRYCSPSSGSTIACISISRASAGSLYPSFGFNINLLSSLSLSLILLLLTLLVALIRHIKAWWCAITSWESTHHYHRVTQTPALGEVPPDPSLELGPSRAITQRLLVAKYDNLCESICPRVYRMPKHQEWYHTTQSTLGTYPTQTNSCTVWHHCFRSDH
jgi:hypothetical protein